MSNTENSFMKAMFFGEIREDLLFPYPSTDAAVSETVSMIVDTIQKYAKDNVKSAEWDEKGEMPREIVQSLAEMGMLGLAVPEALGGVGLPQSGYARVMQEVASIDASMAVTIGAHQSIGYKALLLFGSDAQKQKYLPKLASGEMIACYCLTEPGSGSDAQSIKTKATLSADGKHWVINGNKLWITNGGIAQFMTVFAKTEVEEEGKKKEKVTCFIVEAPSDGISVGPAEHKLGIRASWTNAIHFDNVKVPVENVIGGVGYGFKVAMGVLNHGRMGLAAGAIGGSKMALRAAIEHSTERQQFGKKLSEFGMIQEKIARLAMNIYAAESMVYKTTSLIDRGDVDYSLEGAICKIFASETLWEAVDENLQVWAGNGYMKEYPYERWLRDARINRIFEGTNEILRAFIALSGFQGPGAELAGVADVIKFKLQGLGPATTYASRKVRQSFLGNTIEKAHPATKKLAALIEEYSVTLAGQVDILIRRHGREIFSKQLAQKRIADVAIDLYAMSCILARITRKLEEAQGKIEAVRLDFALAEAFFARAGRRIRGNFRQIDKNEDDAVKEVAAKMLELGGYPFDPPLGKL